jgi:hypothetical protein
LDRSSTLSKDFAIVLDLLPDALLPLVFVCLECPLYHVEILEGQSSCQSRIILHDCTLAAASGLTRVLGPLDLGNHELKGLLYVLVVARGGFGPGAFELCGEGAAIFGSDLALFGAEIGFVADDD